MEDDDFFIRGVLNVELRAVYCLKSLPDRFFSILRQARRASSVTSKSDQGNGGEFIEWAYTFSRGVSVTYSPDLIKR